MSAPIETVELLDRLVDMGFTDEYFDIVHHFNGEPIERHKNIAQSIQAVFNLVAQTNRCNVA
ncbi:MAG: hypothetical protein O3A33_12915 [Chloroflexi bacterium]|nr:hypothetical protein [Chloroflexota bacterium]